MSTKDIAARPDVKFGDVMISPSRRIIGGPGGVVQLEPRTMQVFLLLFDAAGRVVTRNELFDECWGGAMVGDDSLNRAIGKVRRLAAEAAPGLLEVETIPRTGYRLTGPGLATEGNDASAGTSNGTHNFRRRAILVGGLVSAALVGGGGYWWTRSQAELFRDLKQRGHDALTYGDSANEASGYLQQATAIRPDDPEAQGLLAYSRVMLANSVVALNESEVQFREAERAAQAALALDPKEAHARLANILLRRSMQDFASTEDQTRKVLADFPSNIFAMKELWNVLQCVGRSKEALDQVERALRVDVNSAASQFPRAQLLWINGRAAEADRVIDQALARWPGHRFVRFARFVIWAFTGRASNAYAMLEKRETAPQHFSDATVQLWRVNLNALDAPTPQNVASARSASLEAARKSLGLAAPGIMTMAALGELDAAFQLADSVFAVDPRSGQSANARPGPGTAWRFTPWLFIPATAALRTDPRFGPICDQAGLTDYWRKRGIGPDYLTQNA